jgi:hypothetical protein
LRYWPQSAAPRRDCSREMGDAAFGIRSYCSALVGPFSSAEKAAKLCTGLKAAGGDCIIQKN